MLPEVQKYLTEQVIPEHQEAIQQIREAILTNLPDGFEECIGYGMLGYVVPKSIYPNGYHCNTSLPLPFANLASKKTGISLYHMGIYADSNLMDWFQEEYQKRVDGKLDMGKSCIRFKKMDRIPTDLIGELFAQMSVQDWILCYEKMLSRNK
jgi:uncharacterized protein YdhG (YjbR/CyaY superfamily)